MLSCQSPQRELGPEDALEGEDYFGQWVNEQGAVELPEMHRILVENGAFEGKVKGEVVEVCTNKGCWMTLSLPDGKLMRVTFKDYGFFVPTDFHGSQILMEGLAQYDITDVSTLRHFAEDAGKSKAEIEAIVEEEEQITFEAVGVVLLKNS